MPLSREQFDGLRAKGLSVEQIARFDSGERGATLAPTPATPVPAPSTPGRLGTLGSAPIASHPLVWAAQQGMDLPSMLGMAGGFIPGPAGRGAAAIGGASGSVIEQLALGQPFSAKKALGEGLKQAGLTAGGQLLGGASRALGTGLMRTALRPGVGTIRMAPEAVKNALEQGATVRRFLGTGGEEKAAEVMGQRGAVTAAGVERVDRLGVPLAGGMTARVRVNMSRMIPGASDVVAAKSSRVGVDYKEARRVINEMTRSYQKPQNLADVKAIKQQLQDEARAIYEKAVPDGKNLRFNEQGIPIGESVPIEARIKFATAHRLQMFMESIPEGATGIRGGFKASESATKNAIGVRKAIADATLRSESGHPAWLPQGLGRGAIAAGGGVFGGMQGNTPQEHALGAGIGTIAGGMLADPGTMSRLAHLFYNQYAVPALMRQSPRLTEMLFNSGTMPDSVRTNGR